MKRNSQGPSFVPWGRPDGTAPHSEKQLLDSLTRWNLYERKSHTQRATPRGIQRDGILSTRIWWSMSPSVAEANVCIMGNKCVRGR